MGRALRASRGRGPPQAWFQRGMPASMRLALTLAGGDPAAVRAGCTGSWAPSWAAPLFGARGPSGTGSGCGRTPFRTPICFCSSSPSSLSFWCSPYLSLLLIAHRKLQVSKQSLFGLTFALALPHSKIFSRKLSERPWSGLPDESVQQGRQTLRESGPMLPQLLKPSSRFGARGAPCCQG